MPEATTRLRLPAGRRHHRARRGHGGAGCSRLYAAGQATRTCSRTWSSCATSSCGLRRDDDRAAHPEQLDSIGWKGSPGGIGDSANHFHYYRLSEDNRILCGAATTVDFSRRCRRSTTNQRARPRSIGHFFETFPQLGPALHPHVGGAIDTCSRFGAFYGTAYKGKVAARWATPASAWARPGSVPRSALLPTSWTTQSTTSAPS
ncbi:hypothetical protein ACU686_18385 [Yinghuangia aomiensis]